MAFDAECLKNIRDLGYFFQKLRDNFFVLPEPRHRDRAFGQNFEWWIAAIANSVHCVGQDEVFQWPEYLGYMQAVWKLSDLWEDQTELTSIAELDLVVEKYERAYLRRLGGEGPQDLTGIDNPYKTDMDRPEGWPMTPSRLVTRR